ncbi:hypothetical protein [Kribbella sp. DT2]|uniref:hypothetical protein n=1 Tax=Kribbella sp. DT2 TaxID=3393427 RepID=UPI003CE7ECC1
MSTPIGYGGGAQVVAQDVEEVVRRVRQEVARLTGSPLAPWNGRIDPLPPAAAATQGQVGRSADGALQLGTARAALRQLTTEAPGESGAGDARSVRGAVQAVAGEFARRSAGGEPSVTSYAVNAAFVEDNLGEIVRGSLPAEQAVGLTGPEPTVRDVAWAPAARGLAFSVDVSVGRDAEPSETLRELAGRPGLSQHVPAAGQSEHATPAVGAADILVRQSRIPTGKRADAVRAVAGVIDQGFEALPARVAEWSAGLSAGEQGQLYSLSRAYGQEIGQSAWAAVKQLEGGVGQTQEQAAARLTRDPAVRPLSQVTGRGVAAQSAAAPQNSTEESPVREV